ncbi:unnamed protein product, partial [Ectocarpus sp. 12 AP-2014]
MTHVAQRLFIRYERRSLLVSFPASPRVREFGSRVRASVEVCSCVKNGDQRGESHHYYSVSRRRGGALWQWLA